MTVSDRSPVTVLVPARNEAGTIARVVDRFLELPWVAEVLVVDNGSDDGTSAAARSAGARVVVEKRVGMGAAVRAGLAAASQPWVMKVDADLDRFETSRFAAMERERGPGIGLVKGDWTDPQDDMPMTRLLVRPAIAHLAPGLGDLRAPNSGIYLVDRRWIAHQELVSHYAADLDVMLRVHAAGAQVVEVDIGRITHDTRNPAHYSAMATTIMGFFLECHAREMAAELLVCAAKAEAIAPAALAFYLARARGGARVQFYLQDQDTPAGLALARLCAPYPTVAKVELADMRSRLPGARGDDLRLFAPYPVAPYSDVTRAALTLQSDLRRDGVIDPLLWLMPPQDPQGSVQHFRADMVFDSQDGADLARYVLGSRDIASRATFQSYGSLPDALKLDLIETDKSDTTKDQPGGRTERPA